jgi:Calcineurin-like phosphoesterase superfamily domain
MWGQPPSAVQSSEARQVFTPKTSTLRPTAPQVCRTVEPRTPSSSASSPIRTACFALKHCKRCASRNTSFTPGTWVRRRSSTNSQRSHPSPPSAATSTREHGHASCPRPKFVEIGGISIYVLHDLARLDLKPEAAGFRIVISGHSHVPGQETKNGVLYLNPGSAGLPRFKLPVSVARVTVSRGKIGAEILVLSG